MTEQYIEYIVENAKSVGMQSHLIMNNTVLKINGTMEKHLAFYEESDILPESFLAFKYFGEEAFDNEKFNDEGDFLNIITKTTIFQISFKDGGIIFITDTVDGVMDLWVEQSEFSNGFMELLELEDEDSEGFVNTFADLYLAYTDISTFSNEGALIEF